MLSENTTGKGFEMKKFMVLAIFTLANMSASAFGSTTSAETRELKMQIVDLAKKYEGQADPDFSRQKSLEVLVDRLLESAPQKPVQARLQNLYGAWKQVWGPYNYRESDRSVDPSIGVKEIYQVVFEGGYYYNVAPAYKNGDLNNEKISFLRGEFKLSEKDELGLDVRFTNLTELKVRPESVNLWDLASEAEANTLDNEKDTLPSFFVKLFFQGGTLREVYTDNDLRILYGTNSRVFKSPYLYVMTKVGQ